MGQGGVGGPQGSHIIGGDGIRNTTSQRPVPPPSMGTLGPHPLPPWRGGTFRGSLGSYILNHLYPTSRPIYPIYPHTLSSPPLEGGRYGGRLRMGYMGYPEIMSTVSSHMIDVTGALEIMNTRRVAEFLIGEKLSFHNFNC